MYNYNKILHRGVGMTPNEAADEKNHGKVLAHMKKYKIEFDSKSKNEILYVLGDDVLIRNEFVKDKMDDIFCEPGVVIKRVYGDVYDVRNSKGKVIRRHAVQLRGFKEGGKLKPIRFDS